MLVAIYYLPSSHPCILWMLSGVNSASISPQQIEPLHAILFNLAPLHRRTHVELEVHPTIITDRTGPQLFHV